MTVDPGRSLERIAILCYQRALLFGNAREVPFSAMECGVQALIADFEMEEMGFRKDAERQMWVDTWMEKT